jgi:hypothetical protein
MFEILIRDKKIIIDNYIDNNNFCSVCNNYHNDYYYNNHYFCFVCNKNIKNMLKHINTKTHKKKIWNLSC